MRNIKFGAYIWRFRIYLLPILIVLLFIIIYRLSNPIFNNIFFDLEEWITRGIDWIIDHINIDLFWTFVLGMIISNTLFIRVSDPVLTFRDASSPDKLIRTRRRVRSEFRNLDLRNEFRAALFLLIVLNLLLLTLNVVDIKWVWFNFEWEGQYLKSYVHEGAYLLILSILISIALVLWIFRRNLNFIRGSAWLRKLSYLWLAQNAVLTLSVAIRNYHYIKHFALAYGRIGVYIFIILTIFGLITVFFKIRRNMSNFYIFKVNAYAWYMVLLITSFVNWDLIIARYNFSHADKAFLHLDFMSKLSDKTLPYLDRSLEELNSYDSLQMEEFPFRHRYMNPQDYLEQLQVRKEEFKESWEGKGFLSWNLAEQRAYNKLKANESEGIEH